MTISHYKFAPRAALGAYDQQMKSKKIWNDARINFKFSAQNAVVRNNHIAIIVM